MTDQRPIDPSTLRDGDIVRAKRGEYGVVEGVFHSYPISSGWGIGSEAEEDGLFAWNDKGWTITDILRPVLVKGDRAEWIGAPRKRKASTATVSQVNGDRAAVIRDDDVCDEWPISAIRRLPAAPESDPECPFPMGARVVQPGGEEANVIGWEYCAECGRWEVQVDIGSGSDRWAAGALTLSPEPAPIEVGDWLKSLMDKDSHVVTSVDGDWIGIRWWQSGAIYRVNRRSIEGWTRLDGPPEPPQGTVYVIGKTVWYADDWGHIAAAAGAVALEWSTVCGLYDTERLATLQIVHTMEVE